MTSPTDDRPQCEANVWVRHGYWHKFQCKRLATTEVDRLPLCSQHAKIAEKRGIRYVQ